MENFNITIKSINFPEPFKGGWLKSYCEQQKVSNIKYFKIRCFDNKFILPQVFKFEQN
jgi:hypothetical protein